MQAEYSSLPTRKYKFPTATPRRFVTNFYTIKLNQARCTIYQFSYLITPEIQNDSSKKLQSIIRNVWKDLVTKIGLISVRGNALFGTRDIKGSLTFKSKLKNEDTLEEYQILIKKVKDLPIGEMLLSTNEYESKMAVQVLNVDTKQRLLKMNLIQLDKGRYYGKQQQIIQNQSNGFIALKGYNFTTEKLKIGLCLHVQLFSRLIRQRSVLEQIQSYKSKDEIKARLTNAIVITRYGNFRTYKVIGVDFEKSPKSKFIPCNQSEQTTYLEYYKKHYDVNIMMKNQPLLHIITKTEKVKRKGDVTEKVVHQGYLIPQLVSLVGLSDEHISNTLLMKQISAKTQMSVDKRIKQTTLQVQNLNKQQGLYEIGDVKVVNGYQLQQPLIQLKQRQFKARNGQIRIEKQLIKEPASFENWYFIAHKNYQDQVYELEKALRISSKTFGITLAQSEIYWLSDAKAEHCREDIQQQFDYLKQNKQTFPQIVMVLIGGHLKDSVYHEIKNLCTTKYKVCTQFTTASKVAYLNKKNCLLSYASSIILQMNCKVGKTIWQVPVRHPSLAKKTLAVCAIAISKNSNGYTLGFVGTVNNKLSKVYNQTKLKKRRNQFTSQLMSVIFINWIKCFYQCNGKKFLPDIIVFYREGLNQTDAKSNVQIEIDGFQIAINEAKAKTKLTNFNPEIVYMSVNKRSTTRFYEEVVSTGQKFTPAYTNPQSGSIILDELAAEKVQSFHMVSTSTPTNSTSNPSQITFHYHQPARTPQEAFIELSFQQCFNYYNWKGAIKPPACLQNADKLAKLAGKSLKSDITWQNELSKTFHFL